MSLDLNSYRKALRTLGAKAAGVPRNSGYLTVGANKTNRNMSDLLKMPSDPNDILFIQDLNPASSTFGMFYFMPGFDGLDNGNPLA